MFERWTVLTSVSPVIEWKITFSSRPSTKTPLKVNKWKTTVLRKQRCQVLLKIDLPERNQIRLREDEACYGSYFLLSVRICINAWMLKRSADLRRVRWKSCIWVRSVYALKTRLSRCARGWWSARQARGHPTTSRYSMYQSKTWRQAAWTPRPLQ